MLRTFSHVTGLLSFLPGRAIRMIAGYLHDRDPAPGKMQTQLQRCWAHWNPCFVWRNSLVAWPRNAKRRTWPMRVIDFIGWTLPSECWQDSYPCQSLTWMKLERRLLCPWCCAALTYSFICLPSCGNDIKSSSSGALACQATSLISTWSRIGNRRWHPLTVCQFS